MKATASLATGLGANRGSPREPTPETERPVSLPAVVERAHPEPTRASANRVRPDAALIAQLIGGVENMPGSRARRRAAPAESAEVYRRIAAFGPPVTAARSTSV